MKSMKIIDCIKTILPRAKLLKLEYSQGEKIHEKLTYEETKNIFDCKNHFIILPEFKFWTKRKYKITGKKINRTFEYSSNSIKLG